MTGDRPETPDGEPGNGPLSNHETRFRKGLEGATGGSRMAVWGILAMAALVGLALLFDF